MLNVSSVLMYKLFNALISWSLALSVIRLKFVFSQARLREEIHAGIVRQRLTASASGSYVGMSLIDGAGDVVDDELVFTI